MANTDMDVVVNVVYVHMQECCTEKGKGKAHLLEAMLLLCIACSNRNGAEEAKDHEEPRDECCPRR